MKTRTFLEDIYRLTRIVRFAPLVTITFLLLIMILPGQIDEVILGYFSHPTPYRSAHAIALSLYIYALAVLIYSAELSLNYITPRPYHTLSKRPANISAICFFLALVPVAVVFWRILNVEATYSGELFHSGDDTIGQSKFIFELKVLAFQHVAIAILILLATAIVYYRLLTPTSQLRARTAWLRRVLVFRFFPIVALGHFVIVLYWLEFNITRILDLGALYFLFQFFAVWVVLFATAVFYADRFAIPLVSLFITVWVLVNIVDLNDHHFLSGPGTQTTVSTQRRVIQLTSRDDPLEAWLRSRAKEARRGDGRLHIFIVAAQGGGVYAAYHTALALSRLAAADPLFKRNLLAVSSVSGGSLGLAVYLMTQREERASSDSCKRVEHYIRVLEPKIEKFFEGDFLSPITTAGMYLDTLQQFNVFPAPLIDRSTYWRRAVAARSEQVFGGDAWLLQQPLDRFRWVPDMPTSFINVTSAQSGQRAYLSPLSVDVDRPADWTNSLARLSRLKRNLLDVVDTHRFSLLDAISVSSRFPLVAPAASIRDRHGNTLRFVDGGYYENSGIATALEIRDAVVRLETKNRDFLSGLDVQIILVALGGVSDREDVSRSFAELMTPLRTFLQTRRARGYDFLEEARANFGAGSIRIFPVLDGFSEPPLGWYMSSTTKSHIRNMLAQRIPISFENCTRSSRSGVDVIDIH